jgi:hypothetical protein
VATVAQVLNRTHRQLLSGVVEERNRLAVAVNTTATTFVMSYDLGGIRPGAVIEIGSEQMYVWDSTEANKNVTVERGFNGTTAVSHTINSVITVNPRFPRAMLLESLNDELADLSSPMHGLFAVRTLDITYNGSDRQINLPAIADIIDVIEVRSRYKSYDWQKVTKMKLLRDMPTKDFGSGMALEFNQQIRNGDMRLTYKAPFGKAVNEQDNIQAICGFPESAEDILVMGIQIRLMSPREMKRNFTESQGDTRRSDEVPAGAVAGSITNLLRMRRDRITAEAAKLARKYPTFLARD